MYDNVNFKGNIMKKVIFAYLCFLYSAESFSARVSSLDPVEKLPRLTFVMYNGDTDDTIIVTAERNVHDILQALPGPGYGVTGYDDAKSAESDLSVTEWDRFLVRSGGDIRGLDNTFVHDFFISAFNGTSADVLAKAVLARISDGPADIYLIRNLFESSIHAYDLNVRKQLELPSSVWGNVAALQAAQGGAADFRCSVGILWTEEYTAGKQKKPMSAKATLFELLPPSGSRSLHNRLIITCAHALLGAHAIKSRESDGKHIGANDQGFFEISFKGVPEPIRALCQMHFSLGQDNPGRFGRGGILVTDVLLPSKEMDIMFCLLAAPISDGRPVELHAWDPDGIHEEDGLEGDFYGFGMGGETRFVEEKYGQGTIAAGGHTVLAIENAEEMRVFDEVVKMSGWQTLKKKHARKCTLRERCLFSLSAEITPGDSGSLLRTIKGDTVLYAGRCSRANGLAVFPDTLETVRVWSEELIRGMGQ
jgi:hypothetical protein